MTLLTTSSIWGAGMLLMLPGTLLAMLGTIFVRRLVPIDRLRTNNEVAGFKFATVGVLYAVLLAFAVLVVWEKLNEAEQNVAREAGAAATLFRLADGMGPGPDAAVRAAVMAYLDAAISTDWQAMQTGAGSKQTTDAIGAIYAALLDVEPTGPRGVTLLEAALTQADRLTEARRERVVVAEGIVPGIIWFTLFFGAFVTLGFTWFFGAENLWAQVAMTGALSALVFAGLLIIVAIDRPFAGTVRIEPEALSAVRADFAGGPPGQ